MNQALKLDLMYLWSRKLRVNTNTMNQVPTQSECYATENEIGKLYKKKLLKEDEHITKILDQQF